MPLPGASETCDEECKVGAGAFAASVCAWPGVLIMSVNAPIASADCRTKREVMRTDGFVTFIRFTVRAREGIVTLSLGGHLGTRMSRTLVLPGLILVAVGLPWRWSGPLRLVSLCSR